MAGHTSLISLAEPKGALSEQLTHQLGDEGKINELLREVLAMKDTDDATSARIQLWAQRV